MAWTVHQSESALDTGTGMTVTLGSATTNGRYLVCLYGAVLAGQAQAVTGWTDIVDAACDAGEAGGWVWAGWLKITANEASITLPGASGTGNQYAALFEVSCSDGHLQVYDSQVNDLTSTGTTIALGSVDALTGDLVMALGLFHDDDCSSFSFSNSFGNGPSYRETSSGTPQLAAQAGYLIVSSAAAYSTTITPAGGPSADQRHGFMVTLHELQAIEIDAGIASTVAIDAGIASTVNISAGVGF